MAPVPANYASTLFVDYAYNGQARSFQLKHTVSVPIASVIGVARAFLEAVNDLAGPNWSTTGARHRAAGSTVVLPVDFGEAIVGQAADDVAGVNYPRFVAWQGRGVGPTGVRWRLSLYGLNFTLPSDYRLNSGEFPTPLANAWTILVTAASVGTITTVNGEGLVLYTYLNVGFNSYHERKLRG